MIPLLRQKQKLKINRQVLKQTNILGTQSPRGLFKLRSTGGSSNSAQRQGHWEGQPCEGRGASGGPRPRRVPSRPVNPGALQLQDPGRQHEPPAVHTLGPRQSLTGKLPTGLPPPLVEPLFLEAPVSSPTDPCQSSCHREAGLAEHRALPPCPRPPTSTARPLLHLPPGHHLLTLSLPSLTSAHPAPAESCPSPGSLPHPVSLHHTHW